MVGKLSAALLLAVILTPAFPSSLIDSTNPAAPGGNLESPQFISGQAAAIPIISSPTPNLTPDSRAGFPSTIKPIIHVPYFQEVVQYSEMDIFWFGQVTLTDNYADVRLGYTKDELVLDVSVVDRYLWYDKSPALMDLTAWDAVSIFIDTGKSKDKAPGVGSYRFTGQLRLAEPGANYQAAWRGDAATWKASPVFFSTAAGYRGGGPNVEKADDGWKIRFQLPFSSFGMQSTPADGAEWGLGVVIHDRDDRVSTGIPDKTWPTGLELDVPATWGRLLFGYPEYKPPKLDPSGSTLITQSKNGVIVTDAMVGGFATCGTGFDRWTKWGLKNYAGARQINIQNQKDMADFPCFSKYYITFPLESVPPGMVIISAKLTLYHFSNAGGGRFALPKASYIQVFSILENWQEATITWNNAPLAAENISGAWVDPILTGPPPPPGVPRTWDVSQAVVEAYAADRPVSLALYSADEAQHSGKYFHSSDAGEWVASGRPSLEVVWGMQ